MKRYFIFFGDLWESGLGMEDCIGDEDDLELAIEIAKEKLKGTIQCYVHVYDQVERKKVFGSATS